MPPLSDLQTRFAKALRDPSLPPPAGSQRRFGVYRNSVRAGILGVLEARFPAVKRLVGDEFFLAMAQIYVTREPPYSPILMLYGAGFPAFIAGFEPAADVPYLADVARLEWLQHEAANAADASPLDAADFAGVPPDKVAELRFALHPSLRPFASDYPALSIWEVNSRPGVVMAQTLSAIPEFAVLLRPGLEVEIRRVPPAFHAFVKSLQNRDNLESACEAAASRSDHFDLQKSLAGLIAMGAIVGYDLAADKATA